MRVLFIPTDASRPVCRIRMPAPLVERTVRRLAGSVTVVIGRDRGADLCLVSGAGPVNERASRLTVNPVHGDAVVVAVTRCAFDGDRLVTVSKGTLSFLSDSLRSPDIVHDGVSMSL